MGLTHTGVAFSKSNWAEPRIINKWPGTNELRNKVQTTIGYRAGNMGFTSWGFQCPPPDKVGRGEAVKDCFKLFLDPDVLKKTFEDSSGYEFGTYDDVRIWYKDFLTALYKYIREYIRDFLALPSWEDHTVEFLFSVPTTWELPVTNEFEHIIKEAGFGEDGKGHSVKIQLTEAEAAAVYTTASSQHRSRQGVWSRDSVSIDESSFQRSEIGEGHTILVCDSGGGTTDVSVVKVVSLKYINEHDQNGMEMVAELEQLDKVNGDAIGSVQIDEAFRKLVDERLNDIRHRYPDVKLPEHAADQMIKDEFQFIKEKVEENPMLPNILLRVPDLPSEFSFLEGRIESGHMVFAQTEIREIFDMQIRGIFGLIDRQLSRMKEKTLGKVSHFVLSGGLCSSRYVQSQLWRRYGVTEHGIKILIDEYPQLVVCKGLVLDRLHRLKYNAFILPSLCCRSSYGVLYDEPFDSRKHFSRGIRIGRDPNGKKYATGQIHWLVRQGNRIRRDEPICQTFNHIVDPGKGAIVLKDTIASSKSPPTRLPSSIHEGDATKVCEIESTLNVDALENMDTVKRKQKRFLGIKFGKEFLKIEHQILVYVGAANLTFEIHFEGKAIGSRVVPVKWVYSSVEAEEGSVISTNGEGDDWYQGLLPKRLA